jgi:prophage regulatory protein
MGDVILRRPDVTVTTGLRRSTLYDRITKGLFPKPVNLGGRAVGWPASEVTAVNSARIAGRTDAEVRELVMKLEAARQQSH